jgi:hypothetical protein
LNQIDGVVGCQEAEPRPTLLRRHREHETGLIAGRRRQEEILGLVPRQDGQSLPALLDIQDGPGVGDLRRRQALDRRGRRLARNRDGWPIVQTASSRCSWLPP